MNHPITADYATLPLPLSDSEKNELYHLETIISEGLQIFYAVGSAIVSIRNKRLYRETHRTFEDYCRERWNITKARAYQLMDAADVGENLSKILDVAALPPKESQARALKAAPPEHQAEVWEQARATAPAGKVTAKHIDQVIQQEFPREPAPAPAAAPARQVSVFIPAEPEPAPQTETYCLGCGRPSADMLCLKCKDERGFRASQPTQEPDEAEAAALPAGISTSCHFCGEVFPVAEVFLVHDKHQCLKNSICAACAATAARQLMPGLLEGFAWYTEDRQKMRKAGLRVLRIDDYACVIREYNGTGWELFEKFLSKADLKRAVKQWAAAPNIIFENHL